MSEILVLAGSAIEFRPDGMTVTLYPDGAVVDACAEDDDLYRQTAIDHGYGADTALMSREHELAHHLLAHLLGLPHSPTLRAVATGSSDPSGPAEEQAAMALQRFARQVGVSLEEVARRHAVELRPGVPALE